MRALSRRGLARCLAASVLLGPVLAPADAPVRRAARGGCLPARWVKELWPAPSSVSFAPTSAEERAAFAALVPALLEAASKSRPLPEGSSALAASVGFRLETWKRRGETFWVLREAPGRRRGAGAYLLRTGPASEDVIQAPHAYFDVGTGPLAGALFACGQGAFRPRAFMTNTAHRYQSRPGETPQDLDHPADVAHNPAHLFQEVTGLLARSMPSLRVVQFHGFGKAELPGREALAAVVSAGSHTPSACARQFAGRLSAILGQGVRLYPDETQVLGGTRNAQAQLLQAYPKSQFVHIELSAQSRRALASPEQLARLGSRLFAPLED